MHNKARSTRLIIALLIALPLFVDAAPSTIESEPLVSLHDGLMTVHKDNAELSDVLLAVAQQANFNVTIYGELDQSRITRQIVAMPLEKGLRAMLSKVNSMLLYADDSPAGEHRIREVRVFDSGKSKSARTISKTVHKQASFYESDKKGLLQELQQSDLAARLYALNQIHQLTDADALDVLRKVLQQDADYQVRTYAIELLGVIGSEAALDIIQLGLGDPDARVRVNTISTLGFIAGERAIPVLGQLLFSETDSLVRQQAIETIAMQPQSDAVKAFLGVAATDTDSRIREFATANLSWN